MADRVTECVEATFQRLAEAKHSTLPGVPVDIRGIFETTVREFFGAGASVRGLASDEAWLAELEREPSLAGIDIRRELGKAQFWAKNNRRDCTRKFFLNWLNSPRCERRVVANGVGASSFAAPKKGDVYSEPHDWRRVLRAVGQRKGWDRDAVEAYCGQRWLDLPITVREEVVKAL